MEIPLILFLVVLLFELDRRPNRESMAPRKIDIDIASL